MPCVEFHLHVLLDSLYIQFRFVPSRHLIEIKWLFSNRLNVWIAVLLHLSGPEKIQAILQMPEPKDVTALKRFLGMVTYLAKVMPHLSDMTEPLRRLEDKNVEFQWLLQHSLAMDTIKKSLTETPVLRYYDVNKPITVQCDASQSGLGAEVHTQK